MAPNANRTAPSASITRRDAVARLGALAALPLLPTLVRRHLDDTALHFRTITELAAAMRRGELDAVTLVEHHLARIERLDGRLNAFITVMREQAMADARRADDERRAGRDRGPLHGIPIGVKDLCDTHGVRTTAGLAQRRDHVPTRDATVVRRLREAGAVIVGKTNLAEGAGIGYSRAYRVPVNPWVQERWTGGSSSGSGVALAAGLCVGAIGTDTGGSIRFPSSQNGVVGLKPTFGRVSSQGVWPLAPSLDHVGPMARSVRDVAILFDAIAGADAADPTTRGAARAETARTLTHATDLAGLRIGIDRVWALGALEPAQAAAMERAMDVLRELGARIVDVTIPDTSRAGELWNTLAATEALRVHAAYYPSRAAEYGAFFRDFLSLARATPAADRAGAERARRAFTPPFRAVLASVDAVLAPGGGGSAPISAETMYGGAAELSEVVVTYAKRFSPVLRPSIDFTAPMDFAGTPSVCVPCGADADGLPIGLQFAGDRGSEATLLRIAHVYEQATAWHARHPDDG